MALRSLSIAIACVAATIMSCGGSTSTGAGSGADGGGSLDSGTNTNPSDAASTAEALLSFAGVYSATYSGTYVVTSPAGIPGGSNTGTATITITNLPGGDIGVAFQLPPNPESGALDFLLSGNSGMATGPATGGECFMGSVNGGEQTNCCTACTIMFSGDTFTQPNAGTFSGTDAEGVAYSGTYTGVWSGTKQ
jgi:hypothetical protein